MSSYVRHVVTTNYMKVKIMRLECPSMEKRSYEISWKFINRSWRYTGG